MSKSIEEMLEAFVMHGMDVSYFKFLNDSDKENFFMMYTDLFQSMTKESEELSFRYTSEKDLLIEYEGKEIYLYITDGYQTLKSDLISYDPEDSRTILMLTILFLTIKELKGMIDLLTDGLIDRANKRIRSSSENFKELPKFFIGKANHIISRQEEIMDIIEEAREKVTIKEIK